MKTVWVLVSNGGRDVEVFSQRPRTPGHGGDPDSWPPAFRLYQAGVDGGDSTVVEEQRGRVRRRADYDHSDTTLPGYPDR